MVAEVPQQEKSLQTQVSVVNLVNFGSHRCSNLFLLIRVCCLKEGECFYALAQKGHGLHNLDLVDVGG